MPSARCLLSHYTHPTTSVSHFTMASRTLSKTCRRGTTNTSVTHKLNENIIVGLYRMCSIYIYRAIHLPSTWSSDPSGPYGNPGIWILQCQLGAWLSPQLPAGRTGEGPYQVRKHFLIEVSNAHHLNKTFNHLREQGDTVSIKSKKRYGWKGQADFALPQSGKALGRDKKNH